MDTKDIATELLALCNAGKNMDAINKFYGDNIVSIEVNDPMRETHGIDAVRGKSAWWLDNHEVHSHSARGPWVNGDQFALEFTYDITFKPTGARSTMNEIAVYTVAGEKIVHEKFLYAS